MASDMVFQGNFSFVNVDANSLSTLPHRQQVTRHVHGYRRWKKGQEARRLRESSRFHDPSDRTTRPQLTASSTATAAATASAPRPGFRHIRPTTQSPPQDPARPSTIRTLPSLIDIILLSGSSDPFDALPERLTARVNSLLAFEKDFIFPSIRALELRMTPKGNAAREVAFTTTWISESKAYLYDTISIHSYLARVATHRYMFTSQPEFLDAAHEFRRKGVESLKSYMASPQIDVLRLYRGLLILLWADSALGDREAFQHHVAVLKDMFQSHHDILSTDTSSNLHHFVSVVYFEVQYAVMGLAKASLNLEPNGWVEKQFLQLWDRVSPNFPFSRAEADPHLSPRLQGDIRSLYLDVQEILEIIRLMRIHNFLNTSLTWFHAISKTVLTMGRLVNLFVELEIDALVEAARADMDEDTALPPPSIQRLETAIACLCAVFWLRELAGIEHIPMSDSIKLFTWNPVMLGKLRYIVRAYYPEIVRAVQQQQYHANAYDEQLGLVLWVFWTGAMAEHSLPAPDTIDPDDQYWFTRQFSGLCRAMNVRSVWQCQGVVDHFLRLHGMKSSGGDDWVTGCFSISPESMT